MTEPWSISALLDVIRSCMHADEADAAQLPDDKREFKAPNGISLHQRRLAQSVRATVDPAPQR